MAKPPDPLLNPVPAYPLRGRPHDGNTINIQDVPWRFREDCSCCKGEGSHHTDCGKFHCSVPVNNQCGICKGTGTVLTREAYDIIRLVRSVTLEQEAGENAEVE